MGELARIFVNIALLRRGPEDVPASVFLLVLLNVVTLASYALAAAIITLDLGLFMAQILLNLALSLLLTAAVLSLADRSRRFLQTATAIAGAELVLAPLSWLLIALGHAYEGSKPYPLGPYLAQLLVFAWDIVIVGHIYRRALERSLRVGILLSVACAIIVLSTVALVFPEPAA